MSGQDEASASDKRRHPRRRVLHSGTLHQGDRAVDCVIKDISAAGVQLVANGPVSPRRDLVLELDRAGLFPGRIVWSADRRFGLEFLQEPNIVARRIGAAWRVET